LKISVYAGQDGSFALYEDDGITESYKKGEKRETRFTYHETSKEFEIGKAEGEFSGAPASRSYRCEFIGMAQPSSVTLNGAQLNSIEAADTTEGYYVNSARKTLVVNINAVNVLKSCTVKITQ
jgi:hypothetical protein